MSIAGWSWYRCNTLIMILTSWKWNTNIMTMTMYLYLVSLSVSVITITYINIIAIFYISIKHDITAFIIFITITVECQFKTPGVLNWPGGCTVNLARGGS